MTDKNEQKERRFVPFTEIRVETDADGKSKLVGYAAVFDTLSEDLGGFRERVASGAFDRTLKEGADVRALVDHDPSKMIGRNKAKTLKLKVDKKGLHTTIDLPDTTAGRDIKESVNRGDVDGMSFGFITVTDAWEMQDKETVRTLKDVDLFDVSPVTFPAYPDTSVALRSKDKAIDQANKEGEEDEEKKERNWKARNKLKRAELESKAIA